MTAINEWLVFSLMLLAIWLVVFLFSGKFKKEMLLVSFLTMPFGLTEPLFVPAYWNPPSLLNLAATTGFDIESLIFSFAIGGIGSIIYDIFFGVRHRRMKEKDCRRHRLHLLALLSPFVVFIVLWIFTELNPIYSASIAMFVGGISAVLCRPDLIKKTFFGGIMFMMLYLVFFLLFNLAYPSAVGQFWNLPAISGLLILGVPLEELMFAFSFGLLWSGVYEHIGRYKNEDGK